jgi:hypothetical protein
LKSKSNAVGQLEAAKMHIGQANSKPWGRRLSTKPLNLQCCSWKYLIQFAAADFSTDRRCGDRIFLQWEEQYKESIVHDLKLHITNEILSC